MRGISKYGALAAKIRGMRSYLLTDEELIRLSQMDSVKEIAVFLKSHPGYKNALESLDPENMRRETFERLLLYSAVRDMRKIYLFLGHDQRKYFEKAFIRIEILFLKNCLRQVYNKYTGAADLSIYRDLFIRTGSSFDFDRVLKASSPEEFCRSLDGSIYEEPLRRLKQVDPSPSLFEYQRCLDMFYYTYIWDAAKNFADKYDREIILKTNGEDIDLLNLLCIYRLKAHFDVSKEEVFHYLIPVSYKLKRSQLAVLSGCESAGEFVAACKKTYYGKYIDPEHPEKLELTYVSHMESSYAKIRRSDPYSFVIVEAFIFNKRTEIERLISITESIRYGYPSRTILENLNIGGIQ